MSQEVKKVTLPLTDEVIRELKAGMNVLLNGEMLVARDAAHKRIVEALDRGEKPPVELNGQTIYYMGPAPAKPGKVIGAAGPTTSGRMDVYTPRLLQEGLKGMIGKGERTIEVQDAIREHHAVYFAAIGGAGALLSKRIKEVRILAYEDLGAEALRLIRVEDFPVVVICDMHGGNLYEEGKRTYAKR